jgi:hypothetical protein
MNETRPSSLTPKDIENIATEVARRGASIHMTDARFTAVQTWLLTAIGIAIIGLGTWLIKSVNELNITMTRVVTQNESRDAEAVRIRQHIDSIDRRLVDVERPAGGGRR